jgi:hypothetical protein
MFFCNKCYRRYATTDGVRKHANKKHSEWVKHLKPLDYSTECDGVTEWITITNHKFNTNVYTSYEVPYVVPCVVTEAVPYVVTDEDIVNLFFEAIA